MAMGLRGMNRIFPKLKFVFQYNTLSGGEKLSEMAPTWLSNNQGVRMFLSGFGQDFA